MPARNQRRRISAQQVATANSVKTASVYAIDSTKLPGANAKSAVARSAASTLDSSRVRYQTQHVAASPNANTTIVLAK